MTTVHLSHPESDKPESLAAWLIAMLFNPLTLPPVLYALLAFQAGADSVEITHIAITAIVLHLVLPLSYLLVLKKAGRIQSIEARDRSKRSGPLLVGALYLIAAIPIMWYQAQASETVVTGFAIVTAANALIIALITRRFKISMHVASTSGFLAVVITSAQLSGAMLWGGWTLVAGSLLLIPAVIWARIRNDAHSKKEVYAGLIYGLVALHLELVGLQALGIFF